MINLIPKNMTLPEGAYRNEMMLQFFLNPNGTLKNNAPKEMAVLYDQIKEDIKNHDPEAHY